MNFTIKKISDELKILKIEIEYDKLIESNFTGVNSLTKSSKTEITFFHNLKYKDFSVPLTVDFGAGDHWGQAH